MRINSRINHQPLKKFNNRLGYPWPYFVNALQLLGCRRDGSSSSFRFALYLIGGCSDERVDRAKLERARELNIQILDEAELLEMLAAEITPVGRSGGRQS